MLLHRGIYALDWHGLSRYPGAPFNIDFEPELAPTCDRRILLLSQKAGGTLSMKQMISDLLQSYELGEVNRRELVQGLAAIASVAYATLG